MLMEICIQLNLILQPVEIFRSVRLAKQGLDKLNEARQSGKAEMPAWLTEEMKNAEADPEQEVS